MSFGNSLTRIREFVDSRLQPEYIQIVAIGAVVLIQSMAIVQLATSQHNETIFGTNLGADFSGFYVAAQILDRGQPQQLYDQELNNRLWHELLPHEDEESVNPYIHPPFVAGLFRWFTRMPYPIAFAIWSLISAAIYLTAIQLIQRTLSWPDQKLRWLVLLLCFSFEPYAFRSWIGGQLSAVAFFGYALCFVFTQRSQSILAGVALGICFYKPTLLVLILPMLIIGRRWKTLLGMSLTGFALACLSFYFVGWEQSLNYPKEMLAYSKLISSGILQISYWKYVDLNNCLRVLVGRESQFHLPLLLLIGVVPLASLTVMWWRSDEKDIEFQRLLWATTLTWIPVLNSYVGIYDSILVVQSIVITASAICLINKTATPIRSSGLAYLILLIYLAPWFSPKFAELTRISVYTMLLMALGIYQIVCLVQMRPGLISWTFFPRSNRIEPTQNS